MFALVVMDLIRLSLAACAAGYLWTCASEAIEASGFERPLGFIGLAWHALRDGWARAGEMAFHATQPLHADAVDFPV